MLESVPMVDINDQNMRQGMLEVMLKLQPRIQANSGMFDDGFEEREYNSKSNRP